MTKRAVISIDIDPKLKSYVERRVKSGHFKSFDEALEAGLRSLQEDEKRDREAKNWLRAEIAVGLDQARRGDLHEAELVFDELDGRSATRRRKSG